jgi:general secretion pathway protein I
MPTGAARRHSGFSLLEAIVAMVIISGAALALYAWISGNIASLTRLQEANQRSEATLNVLEYMERVNPMAAPEGNASLGLYSIRWRASAVSALVDGVGYPRGISLHQLGLFRVDVSVLAEDGKPWFELELRQVGYKRVRDPSLP